jgi:nitroreductase
MSTFQRALEARYRVPGLASSAPATTAAGWSDAAANPVIESLLGHRSVRGFLPDALPDGALSAMVAAAQSAATSSNLQAWSVVAVRDAQRKARLADLAGGQAHIRECPLFLLWIADLSRLDRVGKLTGTPANANQYLEMFLVAVVDAALAAQNAVAAAESLGLGTVYIGAMRNHPEKVALEIGLPADAFAVFGLCVGHPDPARPSAVKPRLDPSVVLSFEQYQGGQTTLAAPEQAAIGEYDQIMRAFQASQGMPAADWSAQSSSRVRGPESLSGRDRLKAALAALGIPLA